MKKVIITSLEELRVELSKLIENNELTSSLSENVQYETTKIYISEMTAAVDNLIKSVGKIEQGAMTENLAFSLIASISEIETTNNILMTNVKNNNVQSATPWYKNLWSKLKSHIKPAIKNISSALWACICKMIIPTGWKIGGELSTGVLGLAKCNIEISFG
ncbi:hypothetical protein [Neptunicella sp. SCSIO 80796]|uniref:hypothetical protein n=1 Tax=Neptunicella plasticusilytica TaxID=3117012 RepID=UPI003A4D5C3C